MPSNFPEPADERLMSFAVGLATAARIFTSHQLAKHYDLSKYREPEKRAREWLSQHPDVFESTPGPHGEPWRRRLTKQEKRRQGLKFRTINGTSQKSFHWLGLGSIWTSLTQYGGRPDVWLVEPDGQFDVLFSWMRCPWLLEFQRTPITSVKWTEKWRLRREWYGSKGWKVKPRVILVDLTGQELKTIQPPKNTVYVTDIWALPNALVRTLTTS